VSISLHPGVIKTDLARYSGTLIQRVMQMTGYSVSYGAISSLYAGTEPAAGELNGKVSFPSPGLLMKHRLIVLFCSISPAGHGSHFQMIRRLIPSWGRRCGIGVKSRSKTSNSFLASYLLWATCCTSFSCPKCRSPFASLVPLFDI
jgi:hypothetical protein